MQPDEAERLASDPESLADWLDANYRSAILEGLRLAMRRSQIPTTGDPEEFYGHALERLIYNRNARDTVLRIICEGHSPESYITSVAFNVGREATRPNAIDKETIRTLAPGDHDCILQIAMEEPAEAHFEGLSDEVRAALWNLPRRNRRIVREHLCEARTFESITRRLSTGEQRLTPSQVRALFFEGLELLRESLEHLEP